MGRNHCRPDIRRKELGHRQIRSPACVDGALVLQGRDLGFRALCGLYQDETAGAAFVHELDGAGYLGEKGIVFAAADVCAGLNACAALPHNDGAAGDKLSAKCLYAKPLRVGVAPVSGTA